MYQRTNSKRGSGWFGSKKHSMGESHPPLTNTVHSFAASTVSIQSMNY